MKIYMSNLARVMNCAGFTAFDLPWSEPDEKRKEGTAAGEYLEGILTGLKGDFATHASNGVPFNDDMKFYAGETANEIIGKSGGSEISCENVVDWGIAGTNITLAGRGDVSFTNGVETLYVDDYKYGWGLVEVFENWQLLGYAIGEVIKRGVAYPNIVMRIHQPRPHHEDGTTREWRIGYDDLLNYKQVIEDRLTSIANGNKEVATNPHCKYCPAAAEKCPAFSKAMFRGIECTQDFIEDSITDEELSFQMDLMSRINDVFKTKMDSIKDLVATRIKAGKLIPNYVTTDRFSDRKWKKDITPQVIKMMSGIDVIEKKMLSPAKAEKIGLNKKLVESMVERRFLGQNVKRTDTSALGDKIFGKGK